MTPITLTRITLTRFTRFLRITWPCVILLLAGCSDNLPNVLRDYYNVEHEILDNMTYITDDESAKRFNDEVKNRFNPREQVVRARKEKLEKSVIGETDRKLWALLQEEIEKGQLKGQISSLDARFRILQNRHRRVIVKMVEDQAETQMQVSTKSFTVEATALCPNLSNLEIPDKFNKDGGGMGGGGMGGAMMGMGGPPAGMMMKGPPGMPGGGMPGGGMPGGGNPEGGGGGGGNALANGRLYFSMTCERRVDDNGRVTWNAPTRAWKSGNTTVTKLEVNGVNLVPTTSVQ